MADERVQPVQEVVHDAPLSPERRAFLLSVSIVLSALAGDMGGVPVVGFLLAPLLQMTPDIWRSVGKTDDFEIGKTVRVTFVDPSPLKWAGVTAKTAAWLWRRGDNDF